MRVTDKIAVVTGAASGLGLALCCRLVEQGAMVAALDRNQETLNAISSHVASDKQDRISTYCVDVTNRDDVFTVADKIQAQLGNIDLLINNAGIIQPFEPVEALSDDAVSRVFDVNFTGTLNMTRAFLPQLKTREQASLVNISSMGAYVPVPGQVIYGASKAAVALLTQGLRSELTGTSVNVHLVYPGAIKTNITANSSATSPARKADGKSPITPLEPEEAATLLLEGIKKGKPRIFVGKDARIMNLLARVAPERAANLVQKKMASLA